MANIMCIIAKGTGQTSKPLKLLGNIFLFLIPSLTKRTPQKSKRTPIAYPYIPVKTTDYEHLISLVWCILRMKLGQTKIGRDTYTPIMLICDVKPSFVFFEII